MTEMKLEAALARLLQEALRDPERRGQALRAFQDTVADTPTSAEAGKEQIWTVLDDLSIDLEFYESNPGYRAASQSYYGDERLEELLRAALAELDRLGLEADSV
ncbi:MAG: hypothetical protein KY467_07745 [Gemmatimonadetes bacterium]|nr:hypothetical protein [Gemmatimonadota bacterium]